MKILFIILNNLIVLIGVFFWEWNLINILLIYAYEGLLILAIVLITLKRAGGNKLLYQVLPINKSFYDKTQYSKNKKYTPMHALTIVSILSNILIVGFIFELIGNKELASVWWLIVSIPILSINYFINFTKNINLTNEKNLVNFISLPAKNIFVMHYGLIIGMMIAEFFGELTIVLASIVLLRIIMEIVVLKSKAINFNKRIIHLYGIKLLGIK